MKKLVIFCIWAAFFIGTADAADCITAGAEPQILYMNESIATLWAKVSPPSGVVVNQVRAEIDTNPPVDITLSYDSNEQTYKQTYSNFTTRDNIITFYAETDDGVCDPVSISVIKKNTDQYEDDDAFTQANPIVLNSSTPQHRNFHDAGDTDWVKFYGISGITYTVKANNLNVNSDAVIEIYASDGTTKKEADLASEGTMRLASWTCTQDGVYYVKLKNSASNLFGENAQYDLEITRPTAGDEGFITGTVSNACGMAIKDAMVRTTCSDSQITGSDGKYTLKESPGTCTLIAEADGYQKFQTSVTIQKATETKLDIVMYLLLGNLNGDCNVDLKDAITGLRVMAGISCTVHIQADVNKDGRIGLEEVIYILQKIAGLR